MAELNRAELAERLRKITGFFQARADMAAGDGKALLASWAGAAEVAARIVEGAGGDKKTKNTEPMEPIVKEVTTICDEYTETENRVYCPMCKARFFMPVYFCPVCGQAIKHKD